MPPRSRPTLREVSRRTGLSIYTVSRALSGQDGVSEATRSRVQAVAREMGYVANQLARSLKGNSSRTIGILAAHTSNQYYATLVGAMDRELRQEGFQSILTDTAPDGSHDVERETAFVSALLEQRVAAVVVTYSLAPSNLKLLADWQLPLVFVDCIAPALCTDAPSIICDNEAAGHLVGDHFAEHGYGRWALLGYPPLWSSRITREAGFVSAAARHGAHLDRLDCGNDSETAHDVVLRYLDDVAPDERAEAFYCANTPLLQGTLRAFAERRVRVPRDMAVIAFDEFEWAGLLQPPMTVIDQHTVTIGKRAAARLLTRLKDEPSASAEQTLVAPDLIIRQSCGCPPPRRRSLTPTQRGTST